MCLGIDLLFKNEYRPVIKNYCPSIFGYSSKTGKSMSVSYRLPAQSLQWKHRRRCNTFNKRTNKTQYVNMFYLSVFYIVLTYRVI